ncbi:hypothetical protein GBAR_LOCUS23168 [Geodia barretti]|uniref:Uncharacterized protein n=1 Tax=Geodia barretti TaxID=519541 RepID=A0AA35X6U4_GEOBA|nr:hypothetical protein GBAR_LOCUS23168 [Geodia barretti]
MRKLKANLLTR